jgi:hypothetical protein
LQVRAFNKFEKPKTLIRHQIQVGYKRATNQFRAAAATIIQETAFPFLAARTSGGSGSPA